MIENHFTKKRTRLGKINQNPPGEVFHHPNEIFDFVIFTEIGPKLVSLKVYIILITSKRCAF